VRLSMPALRASLGSRCLVYGWPTGPPARVQKRGAPPGIPGSTNALRVHQMGDAVGAAAPAYEQ